MPPSITRPKLYIAKTMSCQTSEKERVNECSRDRKPHTITVQEELKLRRILVHKFQVQPQQHLVKLAMKLVRAWPSSIICLKC